jgi:acyl-coenzyme A synthetase/AMP-(fatty) acid ligase
MVGYWNNKKLTDKSFYKLEVAEGYQHVYYRTGDLVHENDKNELMFLGRIDRQIKLRGYRIELDEVEATLLKNDHVEEAAVIVIHKDGNNKELEAVVRLVEGAEADAGDILLFCKNLLPSYALPQSLTVVKEFPRTGTGKIDRTEIVKMLATQAI